MQIPRNLGFISDFARKARFSDSEEIPFGDTINFDPEEIEEGRALAVLAYVPFLCFIPFIQGKDNNRFAYEHGKQGVLLFLFEIAILLGALFWKAALFIASVVAIVGIIYVIQGRFWKIPWLGGLAEKIDSTKSNFDNT